MKEEPAMPQNNSAGRHLFLALIWTAAAVFMAIGIIVNLPGVAPLPALLLGLSGLCAITWWGAYLRAKKANR